MSSSTKKIVSSAKQGPQLLDDFRQIERKYGVEGTFSYAQQFLDFEQYFHFYEESFGAVAYSFAGSLLVIVIVTADIPGTILVGFSVLLVCVYLVGVFHFWGITFSSILNVNIALAFSVSIDFSQHIMQQYLNVKPPASCKTDLEKRVYKATKAISMIGSSVVHCGLSTFCSILPLAPSQSYIF